MPTNCSMYACFSPSATNQPTNQLTCQSACTHPCRPKWFQCLALPTGIRQPSGHCSLTTRWWISIFHVHSIWLRTTIAPASLFPSMVRTPAPGARPRAPHLMGAPADKWSDSEFQRVAISGDRSMGMSLWNGKQLTLTIFFFLLTTYSFYRLETFFLSLL